MALTDFTTSSTTYSNNANQHTVGGGLYEIVNEKVKLEILGKNLEFDYPKAIPKGNIDVRRDFLWSNSSTDKSEVPVIYAEEFVLTWGQTITNLQRIYEGANQFGSGKFTDPYLTMYSGKKTGFNYCFPHLLKNGSNLREISNTWSQKNEFDAIKTISQAIPGIKELLNIGTAVVELGEEVLGGVTTGFGYEETQKYSGTGLKTVTVSFPLYNTKDTKSAFKHYCFCLLFAFQNLKTRTSFMTYIPPKLYTISNPYNGGVYIPVAVVSNFSVESIGTTRVLSDHYSDGLTNSPILIPEAYKVTIAFQELIPQSANIMLGAMGGSKISVINEDVSGGLKLFNNGVNWKSNQINQAQNFWTPEQLQNMANSALDAGKDFVMKLF